MNISKLNILFIKKFLSEITIHNVDMFNLNGRSFFTNEVEDIIKKHPIKEIMEQNNIFFVPIEIQEKINFILKIESKQAYYDENLKEFSISLKNMIETSLTYINDRNVIGNINMLNDFLTELLLRESFDHSNNLIERANLLHFDYSIERKIVIVDINHFKQIVRHSSDKIEVQEKLNTVHQVLKNNISSFSEYVPYLYDDKFVLFKLDNEHFKEDLLEIRRQVEKETSLTVQFVVSRACYNLEDYRSEFKKVTELHEIHARKNFNIPIFNVNEYQIELLLSNIHDTDAAFFTKKSILTLEMIFKKNYELIETFINYFKNNMDTKKTAETMFIHKNTVYYRIKKLSELLNIDIFLPYNCTVLFLQVCLIKNSVKEKQLQL